MSEQSTTSRSILKWLNILGTLLALLAIFGFFAVLAPQIFLTMRNVQNIFRQTVIVGIGAMGMTLVMISGGIDLSVGSLVALVTVVVALVLQEGYGPWTAALCGALVGAIGGAINGILITTLRVVGGGSKNRRTRNDSLQYDRDAPTIP
jgi:ribose transport system permease protein